MVAYFVSGPAGDTLFFPDTHEAVPVTAAAFQQFLAEEPDFGPFVGPTGGAAGDYGEVVAARCGADPVLIIDGARWEERLAHWTSAAP